MTTTHKNHTVESFDAEFGHLNSLLHEMSEFGCMQIKSAVRALNDEDVEMARSVIERDQEMNAFDIRLNEEIVQLIARRQPMASDLRRVITIAKIVTDLERVGDEACKIAQLAVRFSETNGAVPNRQLMKEIRTTSSFVVRMLRNSLEAFEQEDLEKALDVIRAETELDGDFRSAMRRLSTFVMEDARSVGHFVDVVMGIRALERIGGHAKNIGGYVIFLVTGRDVRHENLESIESQLEEVRGA